MKNKSVSIFTYLVASFLFQSCVRQVIANTNSFDPLTGSMLPNRSILVHNEQIVAIGEPGKEIFFTWNSPVLEPMERFSPEIYDARLKIKI